MIIDVSDQDPTTFKDSLVWVNEHVSRCYKDKDDDIVIVSAPDWRLYRKIESIEGYYTDTKYILEFDNENDGLAYLLRWA